MILPTITSTSDRVRGRITTKHAAILYRVPEVLFTLACSRGDMDGTLHPAPSPMMETYAIWVYPSECERVVARVVSLSDINK